MLVIFAVIIGGIITGRLLSSWRLVFVSRMITVIIWLLLFLLGLEVGSDPVSYTHLISKNSTSACCAISRARRST